VQLFEQSAEYRGELVTTGGTIRRALPHQPPRNDLGLAEYYQTLLSPSDYPSEPIMVYCLDLPEGFPTGADIRERAEVTGFYFKRGAYRAAGGKIRIAPMLLARTLDWQKRAEAPGTASENSASVVWIVVCSALFAICATAVVFYRSRAQTPRRLRVFARADEVSKAEEASEVGGTLRQLAEGHEKP
jgi:hypothetical protein